MAQTLIAAYKTIDVEHFAHSYHSYFLRPGDMDKSITFTVDRIRDGKSFTTRSVKAIQEGEVIFNCSISFQKREKGLEHQIEMPDVPEPESLKSEQEIREEILKELKMKKEDMPMFIKQREIEMRPVEHQNYFKPERMLELGNYSALHTYYNQGHAPYSNMAFEAEFSSDFLYAFAAMLKHVSSEQ